MIEILKNLLKTLTGPPYLKYLLLLSSTVAMRFVFFEDRWVVLSVAVLTYCSMLVHDSIE